MSVISVDVDRLNEAFRASPKAVLDLLYTRIPVPDTLRDFVPVRDDGKMSPLGLLNQSLFTDKILIGTFSNPSDAVASESANTFTGFNVLDKAPGFGGRTGGRCDPGPKRSTVAAHYVPVELFNLLWEAAQYAPDGLAERIRLMSNACTELSPLNNACVNELDDSSQTPVP